MSFSKEIIGELDKPLKKTSIKTRKQAGMTLSYIEAWHAIAEANRIFGFDGWTRETVYCNEVCRFKNNNGNEKVGYEARVRITAHGITREGTGHGSGISKDLFDAIEGAAKEAESDAMKRAFMTFGNQFGLALYDGAKEGVEKNTPPSKPTPSKEEARARAEQWLDDALDALKPLSPADRFGWKSENNKAVEKLRTAHPDLYETLANVITSNKECDG